MSAPPLSQLRTIGLFGGLSEDTIQSFVESLNRRMVEPGASVFKEGDTGREMFVVLGGELEVLKQSKSAREARVALLGPNDWFGEMSVLDVMPRSATVRAVAPTQLLVIASQDLDALYRNDVKAYAMLVLNIAREISRRLRVADGILAEMVVNVLDTYSART